MIGFPLQYPSGRELTSGDLLAQSLKQLGVEVAFGSCAQQACLGLTSNGYIGPVLLDFPVDVLFSPVHNKRIAWVSIASPLSYPPGPHPEAIEAAAQLLADAKRPVIITGTGVRSHHLGR